MDVPERRRWELHHRGFHYSVSQALWSAGEHTLSDQQIDKIPEDAWYQFMEQLPKRVRRLRDMAKDQPKPDDPVIIAAMYGVTEGEVRQAEVEATLHPLTPISPVSKEISRQAGEATGQ